MPFIQRYICIRYVYALKSNENPVIKATNVLLHEFDSQSLLVQVLLELGVYVWT